MMASRVSKIEDGERNSAAQAWLLPAISLLIIDDHGLQREALAETLRRREWVGAVRTAENTKTALQCLHEDAADVVLLNTSIQGSIAILVAVTDLAAKVRVVVLGVDDRESDIIAYAEAGVAGYVLRGETLDDLRETVESVVRGEARCSPRVTATLLRRVATLASTHQNRVNATLLTPREREILILIDENLTNKEIARRLSIEVRTVKNHVHHILEKLKVKRRADAAVLLRAARVPTL